MEMVEIAKLVHVVWIPIFLCILIFRAKIQSFREFVDALHSPGASVLVGYILVVTGIVMMKIALVDDGKYIIGGGAGILAKSLTGTSNAGNGDAPTKSDPPAIDVTAGK